MRLVLPFAPATAEDEIRGAFERTLTVSACGTEAKDLAEYWFFETVVRLHRTGEGAPYTGLKPAGLDWGPVIPRAERAIETGQLDELVGFMARAVERAIRHRFQEAIDLRSYPDGDIVAARASTSARLGFEIFMHHLYATIVGDGTRATEVEGAPADVHEHSERFGRKLLR